MELEAKFLDEMRQDYRQTKRDFLEVVSRFPHENELFVEAQSDPDGTKKSKSGLVVNDDFIREATARAKDFIASNPDLFGSV